MKTSKDMKWPEFMQNEIPEAPEMPEMPERAMRFNSGKPHMSYVTDFPIAMQGLARVMMGGVEKGYPRDNWKKGMTENEYLDSMMRHIMDYKDGITYDKETGLHQWFHVMVNAAMLAEIHGEFQEPKVETPENGLMMSNDAGDAAAYAMIHAEVLRDTSRGPVDDTATTREDEPGLTVAGTASTAEDEPPLEPTLNSLEENLKLAKKVRKGTLDDNLQELHEVLSKGPIDPHDFTEAEIAIVCSKAIKLGYQISSTPHDIIHEFSMMFFTAPESRNMFFTKCLAKLKQINESEDNDPLGR